VRPDGHVLTIGQSRCLCGEHCVDAGGAVKAPPELAAVARKLGARAWHDRDTPEAATTPLGQPVIELSGSDRSWLVDFARPTLDAEAAQIRDHRVNSVVAAAQADDTLDAATLRADFSANQWLAWVEPLLTLKASASGDGRSRWRSVRGCSAWTARRPIAAPRSGCSTRHAIFAPKVLTVCPQLPFGPYRQDQAKFSCVVKDQWAVATLLRILAWRA
jgi:hypothetical protein